jgi:hypothetical protein
MKAKLLAAAIALACLVPTVASAQLQAPTQTVASQSQSAHPYSSQPYHGR